MDWMERCGWIGDRFGVAADELGDEEVAVAVEMSPLDKSSLPPSSFLSCQGVKDIILG